MIGIGVFLKYPLPGKVKTRLAATLGSGTATEIYLRLLGHLLEHTLLQLDPKRFKVVLFCDPSSPLTEYGLLLSHFGLELREQRGSDLGERIAHALDDLWAAGCEVAFMVGTDCIDVTVQVVETAAEALKTHDVCLGPTDDGGYYLVGLSRPFPEIFTQMPWSGPEVFSTTAERCRSHGRTLATLAQLRDVDFEEDWRAVERRVDNDSESLRSLRQRRTSPD